MATRNLYRGDVNFRTGIMMVGAACLLAAGGVGAQTVRGVVLYPDSAKAAGVIVIATDARGATAAQSLTSESGRYDLRLPGAGRYDVRVLRIGFRPTIVPAFDIG